MPRDSLPGRPESDRATGREGGRGGAHLPGEPADSPPSSDPRPSAEPESVLLLGVPFHNVTESDVVDWVVRRARSGEPGQIVTSNLDFVRQAWHDPEMHRIHLEADLVVADGIPPVWLSGLFGPALKERVAGSDLVPRLARAAEEHDLSLYAVGAAPGVAERALQILKERHPGLRVAGWESPPLAPLLQMDHDSILAKVRAARPDILLVAFGAPKQDKWIRLHSSGWDVPVAIGVGGSLDFLVGTQARAPAWVGKIGLEWFWRLAGQPRRLFKRYAQDFLFLAGMLGRMFYQSVLERSWSARRLAPPPPEKLDALDAAWATFRPLRRAEAAEAFRRELRPLARDRSLILDLFGVRGLNSLELAVLVSLARACRREGHRLFLAGVCSRIRVLIRLFRLDRYLDLPGTTEELVEELERISPAAAHRGPQFNRVHHRLQVLLPEDFEREAVERTRKEFQDHWRRESIREVVVDAGRMEFIDSAGAGFLEEVRRQAEERPGGSLWLLGFPKKLLDIMRRDGLASIRIDRRKRFRAEPSSRPS